jgi:hypothetical protein
LSDGLITAERATISSPGNEHFKGVIAPSGDILLIGLGTTSDGSGHWVYEFHGRYDAKGLRFSKEVCTARSERLEAGPALFRFDLFIRYLGRTGAKGEVMSRAWSTEDDNQLRSLARSGFSLVEIANQLRRNKSSIRSRSLRMQIAIARDRQPSAVWSRSG